MSVNPYELFKKFDPGLLERVEEVRKFAFAEGAIPVKYKLLIAMAIDASNGAAEGVKALAQAALRAGATKEEVAEALRVAFYLSGCGSFYTAAEGIGSLF